MIGANPWFRNTSKVDGNMAKLRTRKHRAVLLFGRRRHRHYDIADISKAMLLPMLYAIMQSLKPLDELWRFPEILCHKTHLKEFQDLSSCEYGLGTSRYLFNTMFTSIVGTTNLFIALDGRMPWRKSPCRAAERCSDGADVAHVPFDGNRQTGFIIMSASVDRHILQLSFRRGLYARPLPDEAVHGIKRY